MGILKRIWNFLYYPIKVVSLIMICYGVFNLYQYYDLNKGIEEASRANTVQNFTKEELKKNQEKEVSFDAGEVQMITLDSIKNSKVDPKELPTIAGIAIPTINLNLPIYKGISEENMMYGAGTLSPDQVMGERNYLLASHNMIQKGLLFGDVGKLVIGDLIYLTDLDKIYVYKVYRNDVISQYDVHELNDTVEPIVTLITCADSAAQYRYIVQGSLEEVMDFETADNEIIEYFNDDSYNNVWDEKIWGDTPPIMPVQ